MLYKFINVFVVNADGHSSLLSLTVPLNFDILNNVSEIE